MIKKSVCRNCGYVITKSSFFRFWKDSERHFTFHTVCTGSHDYHHKPAKIEKPENDMSRNYGLIAFGW